MPRAFIQTFGCQMNAYDTDRMRELLSDGGWELIDDAEQADFIILNSCAIREKAEQKLTSAAGRFKAWKKERPDALLAISGCVAQQEGANLLKRAPVVDFTFGPDQIPQLVALVERARTSKQRFSVTDFTDVESYTFLDARPKAGGTAVTALVTIQKGCDHHCAYCVVPATRGPEVSRPVDEVVREVVRLVEAGAREVTLVGQNVNSYHGVPELGRLGEGRENGGGFVELLRRVDAVPGLLRLRYTTSHPKDFTPAVARAHAELKTLQPYVHLPVQSGSSRTLRRMVREYSREQYLEQIGWLKAACPDVSLSTDIIVGYPGETTADFEETMSLLAAVEYDSIYSFEYSPRPDTPALKLRLRDDVSIEDKAGRLQRVQVLQAEITGRRLDRWVGRVTQVLVEGEASRGEGRLCGRTPGNEMVNFEAPGLVGVVAGALVDVEITARRAHTLNGRAVAIVVPSTLSAPSPVRRLPVLA
ncbi:MAG: tRNA (N6-isopentenyl adenosine(37)-C2)-methylthiotransferase MiaB [Polyangia bacterium]